MPEGADMKFRGGAFPGNRPCAHPGCDQPGDYRAPRHRPGSAFEPPSGPPDWQYLCLEHVRAFNASWNWFEGMSEEAIRTAQTPYPGWERETRAFAHNAMAGEDRIEDMLGILSWRSATRPGGASPLTSADRQALAKLGLPETATLDEVKAAWRRLARRYHPDANSGDRRHEARFQALREAQAHLASSPTFRRRG